MAATEKRRETLAIAAEHRGTTLVLRLAGELDLASGADLQAALQQNSAAEMVIMDLERLEFMDSAGLRAIYELWQVSRNDGFNLAIVGVDGQVRRVMELTGLDEVLPLADESGPSFD